MLCWQNNMNELGYVSNMIESQVGDVLVQTSKHNLVLLYQKEWKRCKWTSAIIQLKKKYILMLSPHSWTWEAIITFTL